MATRWCLGLKQECSGLALTLRLFRKLIEFNDANNKSHKSEPEKARIRQICGTQVLKLAQESYFRVHIGADLFHIIARLIIVSNLIKKCKKLFFFNI